MESATVKFNKIFFHFAITVEKRIERKIFTWQDVNFTTTQLALCYNPAMIQLKIWKNGERFDATDQGAIGKIGREPTRTAEEPYQIASDGN